LRSVPGAKQPDLRLQAQIFDESAGLHPNTVNGCFQSRLEPTAEVSGERPITPLKQFG
jgi:hypothetical protein